MSRAVIMLGAVLAGIAISACLELLLAAVLPSTSGSLVHWTGNVVSIVAALAIYNALERRRSA